MCEFTERNVINPDAKFQIEIDDAICCCFLMFYAVSMMFFCFSLMK